MMTTFTKTIIGMLALVLLCSCEWLGIGEFAWGFTVINDTSHDFIGILGEFPEDHTKVWDLPQVAPLPKIEEYDGQWYFSGQGRFRPPKKGIPLFVVDAAPFKDIPYSELENTVFQLVTDDMIFATVTITKTTRMRGILHFPDSFENIEYNTDFSIAAP